MALQAHFAQPAAIRRCDALSLPSPGRAQDELKDRLKSKPDFAGIRGLVEITTLNSWASADCAPEPTT